MLGVVGEGLFPPKPIPVVSFITGLVMVENPVTHRVESVTHLLVGRKVGNWSGEPFVWCLS